MSRTLRANDSINRQVEAGDIDLYVTNSDGANVRVVVRYTGKGAKDTDIEVPPDGKRYEFSLANASSWSISTKGEARISYQVTVPPRPPQKKKRW